MATEKTVATSSLEKPLHFLTEEDISQLTREDCRRYLKQKGMRRPSWNKSQAIQQVISLKRLLEPALDSDDGVEKKLISTPCPLNPLPIASGSTSADEIIGEWAAEEAVPDWQRELDRFDRVSDFVPLRNAGPPNVPPGQLTIFYCGKVNVYNDVPAEKAQEIMHLAASPHQVAKQVSVDEKTAIEFGGNHLHSTNMKEIQESPTLVLPTFQIGFVGDINYSFRLQREDSGTFREDNLADGSWSRKALVQRYLEKRKDRSKGKTKVKIPLSASLNIYANHWAGNQAVDELSNRRGTCFSPPIRPPSTPSRCSHFSGESCTEEC